MNDEEKMEALDSISMDSLDLLDKAINDPESNGLKVFSALLMMPDEDFEIVRPLFQEELINAYNEPQAQMQLVQAFALSGISVEELVNHIDEIAESMFNDSEIELSESKKDFLRMIFTAAANSVSSSTINPAHIVEIPVEICRENAKLPTYATNGSGAMDIYSPEEYNIECGQTVIIPIGIKVSIPHGYALLIQPRSGMSARMKVRIPNSPGLIDEDYHEEIGVIVENTDIQVKDVDIDNVTNRFGTGTELGLIKEYGSPITIGKGERFAQMRLVEVPRVKWREVNSLGTSIEDHGKGFGSTGVK